VRSLTLPLTPSSPLQTATEDANLSLFVSSYILGDKGGNDTICSNICSPKYRADSPIPESFSVPRQVKNACSRRCHNWTKDQTDNHNSAQKAMTYGAAAATVAKTVPGVGAVVEGVNSIILARKARMGNNTNVIERTPPYTGYGTSNGGKSHRKRRSKSRKSRRKRRSKSLKSRRIR
jgi:hypothetical protein